MVITSRQNEKLKYYNKLKKDKKERLKTNLICLEGLRLITDCIEYNVTIKEIFITENCLSKNKQKLGYLKDYSVNLIDESLSVYLSDVSSSQGIFAIALNPTYNISTLNMNNNKNYIALSEISDPGNLGTIIRSAVALNFDSVIIENCCDPFMPKSIRSSMGAIFKIPIYLCQDLTNFLNNIKNEIHSFATVVKDDDILTTSPNFKNGLLIIGGEADGLKSSIINSAKFKVKIPINPKIESFNAAVAASICMYEMMCKTDVDFKGGIV